MVAPVFSSYFSSVHVLAGSGDTLVILSRLHMSFTTFPPTRCHLSDMYDLYIPRSTAGRSSEIFY